MLPHTVFCKEDLFLIEMSSSSQQSFLWIGRIGKCENMKWPKVSFFQQYFLWIGRIGNEMATVAISSDASLAQNLKLTIS